MTTNYQTGQTGESGTDLKEKLKQDAGKLKEEAGKLKQEAGEKAREATRKLTEKGKEQAEALSSKAADALDDVEHVAEAEAEALENAGWDNLSEYVREMAHGIGSLSDNLRNKSADELVRTATELARRNTGLFVLGAVAIGFGLSRFAKAAPRQRDDQSWRSMPRGTDGYGYPASENSSSFDAASSDDYEPFNPASDQYQPYDQSPSASDDSRPFERH